MYHFHPQLLLRTPAFSHRAWETNLHDHLTDPYVKAAMYLASRDMYRELEKKEFDPAALDPKTTLALKKYLNRMCFRPTPFGLFAGFSTVRWGPAGSGPLRLPKQGLKVHAGLTYTAQRELAQDLLADELAPHQMYISNPSLYRVQDEYRYLRFEQGPAQAERNFFIDSLESQRLLTALISFCQTARSQAEAVGFISRHASSSPQESAAFFGQLVGQQLLVSTLEANITGEDYLPRLLRVCQALAIDTPRVRSGRAWLDRLKALTEARDIATLAPHLLPGATSSPFTDGPGEKAPLYVNLEKAPVSGHLSGHFQNSIGDGLEALHRLLPAHKPPGLQSFLRAFKQKFEQRAVPLLEALDPEIGVGYENLEAGFHVPTLLQGLPLAPAGEPNPAGAWTPAHALLLDKMMAAQEPKAGIELTEQDLEGLPDQAEAAAMPPSLSVLFRVTNGMVYMEQAGGASATALVGRFTPLSPAVLSLARDLARHEEEANPAVIFAEIAHICHDHTANIDRRETIRGFEIPVLVGSTLAPDRQIPLSDLWVRVEQEQVLLFSKRLRKAVVPRLGSAFNYRRNDLSVFRFLGDLQYQGLKATLTLELSRFFPGLRHYPRVTYRSAILHLASWHLKKAQLGPVAGAPAGQRVARLKDLAATLGWPRHIALTEHDHQLVFDLEKEADVALLGETIKHKDAVVVQEFPFGEEQEALVTDQDRRPYIHQFVAALYHTREVYPGRAFAAQGLARRFEKMRKRLPGSEWLYVKLYCHPSRANELLTGQVLPALNQLLKKGGVKGWFFLRFRDPDYHLRVRLRLPDGDPGAILALLRQKLERPARKGTLRDLQVAVYERELERYTPALMETVEEAFCADSALVAAYLKEAPAGEADAAFYRLAFSGVALILQAFGLDAAGSVRLLHRLYEAFYQEFGGTKIVRDQLSRTFREIDAQKDLLPPVGPAVAPPLRFRRLRAGFADALRAVAQQAAPLAAEKRAGLIGDLMHLHLNRLFTDQARKQELVVYYCLWRHYRSAEARAES